MKKMRGLAVAGLMAVMTLAAGAQTSATVKDDLFAGTEIFSKNATDINEVTMDPGTLGMVDGKDKAKAHRTVLSVVRSYSYDKPGMYRIEDVDAFRNKLNTGDWHCSVHTRSLKTGESTDVCNKARTDDMVETAIITVEPKELTFIHTIRHKGNGEGGWPGMSYMEPGMGMDPAMRAEMAISMAEMHAQMAEMQATNPGISMTMGRLESFDVPRITMTLQQRQTLKNIPKIVDGEIQKQMDAAQKSVDDAKKQGADTQPE